MGTKNNMLIRIKMLEKNITQWEVAEMFGIGESTFTRWLRKDQDEETQKMICDFIDGNEKIKETIFDRLGYRPHKHMTADRAGERYANKTLKEIEWWEERNADNEEWY